MSLLYHLLCKSVKQKILRQSQNKNAFGVNSHKGTQDHRVTPKSHSFLQHNSLKQLPLLKGIKGLPLYFHSTQGILLKWGVDSQCQWNVPRWWHLKWALGVLTKDLPSCSARALTSQKILPRGKGETIQRVQFNLSKSSREGHFSVFLKGPTSLLSSSKDP